MVLMVLISGIMVLIVLVNGNMVLIVLTNGVMVLIVLVNCIMVLAVLLNGIMVLMVLVVIYVHCSSMENCINLYKRFSHYFIKAPDLMWLYRLCYAFLLYL